MKFIIGLAFSLSVSAQTYSVTNTKGHSYVFDANQMTLKNDRVNLALKDQKCSQSVRKDTKKYF